VREGKTPVIRPNPTRKAPPEYDRHLYRERHLVEIFFNRIKHLRRVATRYDKLAETYAGFVHLACACLWLR
jgi:transposase